MHFSTAPSLLVGLSARIFVDKFLRSRPPTTSDSFLLGLWQGVGIYYAFVSSPNLGIGAAFAVGAKLLFDFFVAQDTMAFTIVFLGVSLGILSTDILSRYLDDLFQAKNNTSGSSRITRNRPRSVQFQQSREGEGSERRRKRVARSTRSDIVSVLSLDTNSDLIDPKPSMSTLDREVAALRTQASLADSERRRFKEEKKWAKSQGNTARAEQMSWQVKRYTALMQSFHKEADAKIIEGKAQCPFVRSSCNLELNVIQHPAVNVLVKAL
jgi:hypothetical protein